MLLELQADMVGYLDATSVEAENNDRALLRSTVRKTTQLTGNALTTTATFELVNRRLRASGLPERLSPHSFRVTTISDLVTQGNRLKNAEYLAEHSSLLSTKLYARRQKK